MGVESQRVGERGSEWQQAEVIGVREKSVMKREKGEGKETHLLLEEREVGSYNVKIGRERKGEEGRLSERTGEDGRGICQAPVRT